MKSKLYTSDCSDQILLVLFSIAWLVFPYGQISLKAINVKFKFNVSVAKHRYQTSKSK